MTAVLSGGADIGFMGAEATIYAYARRSQRDSVVNFAQLTQLPATFWWPEEKRIPDFFLAGLKRQKYLAVERRHAGNGFEYILKE